MHAHTECRYVVCCYRQHGLCLCLSIGHNCESYKTAEPIEMPCGICIWVGARKQGALIPPGEGSLFWGRGAPCDVAFRHTSLSTCVVCMHFSHDAHMKAVGHGAVWRSPVTHTIVTACQPCQAFRRFRRRRRGWPNVGNAVLVLSDGVLAAAAGTLRWVIW